uniref:Ion transport domain-containing protein n=1 Tax=Capitella teleta TaxID=283909 RepID=X1ZZA8_CAPTE
MEAYSNFAGTNVDLVEFCIEDLHQVYDHCREHPNKTTFFKIVRGGDTATAKKILDRFLCRGDKQILNWVLNKENIKRGKPSVIQTELRVLVIILIILLFVVLFPVLYGVHGALYVFTTRYGLSPTRSTPQLLLLMAALSEEEDMVRLLKDYGVQIGQCDSYSFNVFHWFVHLSLTNLEKTVRCSSVVVKVYGDEVKCPILYSENRFGLTPLEASVSNGAFLYFDHLSNIQGLLRIPVPLDLSRGSSYGLNASVLQNLEDSSRHYYDVSLFENGLCGEKQSLLLHRMRSIPILNLGDEEANSIINNPFMKRYTDLKVKTYMFVNIFRWCWQLIYSAILFYVVVQFIISNSFPRQFNNYLRIYLRVSGVDNHTKEEAMKVADASLISSVVNASKCLPTNFTTYAGVALDYCGNIAFLKIRNSCPQDLSDEDLIDDTGLGQNRATLWSGVKVVHELRYLLTLSVLGMVLRVLEIVVRTYQTFWNHKSTGSCLLKLFGTKFPGSYMQNQAYICIDLLIIAVSFIFYFSIPLSKTMVDFLNVTGIIVLVMTTAVIISAVSVIHVFRFVPLIGHFIITTFAMSKVLVQFSVVTLSLICVFAYLFSIFIRDPNCPSLPLSSSLGLNVYDAYFLMLGMATGPKNESNATFLLVVMFTVASVLIILNLIIAVMSAVADNMMNYPWNEAVAQREVLVKSLESEAVTKTLLGPLGSKVVRFLKRRAGFIVHGNPGDRCDRVIITVESFI